MQVSGSWSTDSRRSLGPCSDGRGRRTRALLGCRAVVAAALVVVTATAGCARRRPSTVVDRLKTGPPPLCMDHAVIVTGAWSDRVAVVFQRVYAVAKADLGSLRVEVVGVRATVADEHREDGFAVCRTADRAAIAVSERR